MHLHTVSGVEHPHLSFHTTLEYSSRRTCLAWFLAGPSDDAVNAATCNKKWSTASSLGPARNQARHVRLELYFNIVCSEEWVHQKHTWVCNRDKRKYIKHQVSCKGRRLVMMMMAFITIKSGLVPLIEGLCAEMFYFKFEIIGGLPSNLLLFFFERNNMLKKKSSQSKISSRLLAYTYTCVLCTHIRLYTCRDLVHLDLRALQVYHPNPWAHKRITHLCSVYVCVRIHTHTPTYTPTRIKKIEKTQTTPPSLLLSKITVTPNAMQQVPS